MTQPKIPDSKRSEISTATEYSKKTDLDNFEKVLREKVTPQQSSNAKKDEIEDKYG